MAVTLDKVIPFGRSLDEYRKIFSLSDADLGRRIVGVGDGPASFNAEMTALGKSVVSVDPVYTFTADEIEGQFNAVVDNIIAQVKATPDDWVWNYHRSADDLRACRVKVLKKFLADYDQGKREGRYVNGELPRLSFADDHFDLALCSHLLFLYSDHLSCEFHQAAILEMLRLAPEARIFPLLTLARQRSPHVDPVIEKLQSLGYRASIERVDYELQRGGNEMLKVTRDQEG